MKIVGVIPARYGSSRFEGKPLADINGKPMVWWVYQIASKIKEVDEICVATESEKIVEVCKKYSMNVILTSDKHLTGTDRVGEVSQTMKADIYLILMGDEPLINPNDISKLLQTMIADSSIEASMLATKFINPIDVVNTTTIKLAINNNDDLIFMSRSPIPFPKDNLNYNFYKNIGAYAFTCKTLNFFINTEPGNLELAEGLEMIRLLENRKKVKIIKVNSNSMSVDTPKDLERIKKLINK